MGNTISPKESTKVKDAISNQETYPPSNDRNTSKTHMVEYIMFNLELGSPPDRVHSVLSRVSLLSKGLRIRRGDSISFLGGFGRVLLLRVDFFSFWRKLRCK
jgi:hypothetical protein